MFERLNTASVSLNDQELRSCIYRGNFNNLLRELSEDPDFTYLLGLAKPDKRMKDIELVLRFAAFYHATYLRYKPPIRNFLNVEADKNRNISKDEAQQLRSAFKKCLPDHSLDVRQKRVQEVLQRRVSRKSMWLLGTKKFASSVESVGNVWLR